MPITTDLNLLYGLETIVLRLNGPWYSEEILNEKHKCRKVEWFWRRTKLTDDEQLVKDQCWVATHC